MEDEYALYTDHQISRLVAIALGYDWITVDTGLYLLHDPQGNAVPENAEPYPYALVWSYVPSYAEDLNLAWNAIVLIDDKLRSMNYYALSERIDVFWQGIFRIQAWQSVEAKRIARWICCELIKTVRDCKAWRLRSLEQGSSFGT